MGIRRVEISVRGQVQGVGFRAFTRREARRRRLVGYVRNMLDGSVRVVVEGRGEPLDEFIELLGEGPEGAVVSSVEVGESDEELDAGSFVVRR